MCSPKRERCAARVTFGSDAKGSRQPAAAARRVIRASPRWLLVALRELYHSGLMRRLDSDGGRAWRARWRLEQLLVTRGCDGHRESTGGYAPCR